MAIRVQPHTHKKTVDRIESVDSVKQGVIKLSKSNSSVPTPKTEGGSETQPRNQYPSRHVMVEVKNSFDLTGSERPSR